MQTAYATAQRSEPTLIPIQRQVQPNLIRQWSRLEKINLRVTPGTVQPRHFGPGAQFWLPEPGKPEDLRTVGLPDQSQPEFEKLSNLYHEAALRYYATARQQAQSFANTPMGIDFSKVRVSPRRVAAVRDNLLRALSIEPKFSEAWVLLSRSISRQEKDIVIGSHQFSAHFVRSLAAVMANPLSAKLLMQLMGALPEQNQLPHFLTQPQSMPLEKKRLASYMLKFVDPAHEGALCALAESGGKLRLSKILPVRQPEAKAFLKADDIGAIAAFRMGEFWPMMASSQVADTRRQKVAIGNGAFLNKSQLQWFMRLETEEEDPNFSAPINGEQGQPDFQLNERNQARATCLIELAQSLPSAESWLYIPNHMLINGKQMRALAQTFQGFSRTAYERLRQTCGGENQPVPIYRKTPLTPAWIDFYEKVMTGNTNPSLYRDLVRDADNLPERSIHQDQPYVSIFGQAYSKTGLLLRADLFENRQKFLVSQSPVPALKLYMHYANDIALHSSQNPVKIKNTPFVLNVGTQQAMRLVQLLNERALRRRGQRFETQLTRAVRDFLVHFNEHRARPFRTLNQAQRAEDGDFKRALAIVDMYAQMPERFASLTERFNHRMTFANHLAQEAQREVPTINFPQTPDTFAPELCEACRESDVTPENPLITAPFDRGGHRECLAEKMVTTGSPDLRGILQASTIISFLSWVDEGQEAIRQINRFIRSLQSDQSAQGQPAEESDQPMEVGFNNDGEGEAAEPVDLEMGIRRRTHPWDAQAEGIDSEEEMDFSDTDEELSDTSEAMSDSSSDDEPMSDGQYAMDQSSLD